VFLCLIITLWAFGFGLSATLASLWLQQAGHSDTIIGLNTGAYYLGIVLAASFVPWAMRRWSYGCVLAGMILSGLTAAAFPWADSLVGWFILRGISGIGSALTIIPLESYINRHSTRALRARTFAYYAFCFALGMALGTLVGLQMLPSAPYTAFALGGAAPIVGCVVLLTWRPAIARSVEIIIKQAPLEVTRNFLSFGSSWSQGFLEGGMLALLPIYLLTSGFSENAVSWLMCGLMLGVILAQVPVGWLADHLGAVRVLLGCNIVTLLGIGCLMLPAGETWLAVWLFAVGACSGAFYPLGLALLGQRVPPAGLAGANACYLTFNCVGSLMGPVTAGIAMDTFGSGALFLTGGAAIVLALAVWMTLELVQRKRVSVIPIPIEADGRETNRKAA
jgi:MFS family permease